MAACGTFNHIFDKQTDLFDSLSKTKRLQSHKSFEESYFTDILSEIESSSASSASSYSDSSSQKALESSYFLGNQTRHYYTHSKSFSSSMMKSESLSLCTEGLGFESSDEIEEWPISSDWEQELERNRRSVKKQTEENSCESRKMSRKIGGGNEFPPPISSIGKPWMCFRSYRRDGRFILKEVRLPVQEVLHASREDGRLKLQLIQSDDEIVDEEDEGIEERSDDCSSEDCHCDCGKKEEDDEEEDGDDNGEIGREC